MAEWLRQTSCATSNINDAHLRGQTEISKYLKLDYAEGSKLPANCGL